MAKKLHYFDYNGLAESIRYILYYTGHEFEDIRHDFQEWPGLKDKFPFAQMPYYEEGDRGLNQSIAIARYVASKTDLLPADPWDQAVLDAKVLNVYDFWSNFGQWYKEKDETRKDALKETILGEHSEFYLSRFEKELKENNGHFNGKLSWADFILVAIMECANVTFGIEFEKNYPTIKALMQKVTNLPRVKEYKASRKPSG